MTSFLHHFRLYFGVILIVTAVVWDLGHQAGQNSLLRNRGPASAAEEGCTQAMQALIFEGREYLPRGTSFKKKIPNYDEKIAQIESKTFTVKQFALAYKDQHNEFPRVKEMIDKLIRGHQDLVREIQALKVDDESVDYFVDETITALTFTEKEKARYQKFLTDNAAILENRFNPRDRSKTDLRRALESLWRNPFGDLGELKAALHFPGVEALNLHLRATNNNGIGPRVAFHRNKVVQATSQAIERIEEATPEALESWKNRFPLIFTEARMANVEGEGTGLSKVKEWLQSKEVDLVTKAKDGKFYILEVKNYTREMDMEALTSSYRGKKTVFEQQQEMKQILEFLELDGTYTPAITFLNGINEAATRELEQSGILVIPYVEPVL